jgi:hypothetical protein
MAVARVGDDVATPAPSAERVVAVTRPMTNRPAGELTLVAPEGPTTWS